MQKFLDKKVLAGLVGLYLLSAGLSYFAFSLLSSGKITAPLSPTAGKKVVIDKTAPKTEECPLNGQKFSVEERRVWEERRPLTVMIENHEEARPQSGLSNADVVYEAVAEGGVTRFLAVFYCGAAEEVQIGPVRSARVYYMDWASEYGDYPLYAHVGGANKPGPADALGFVRKYGWEGYNDLNQFSIGFPTFWRDYERLGHPVATEHTMYSTTEKLWTEAVERGLTSEDKEGSKWDADFEKWKFKDGKPSASPKADKITFPFWSGHDAYAVEWEYDPANNMYKRAHGGQAQKDLNNDTGLQAANVVILYTRAKGPIDELKHMLYATLGSGKAVIFQDGEVIDGSWKKKDRQARTEFTDKKGRAIEFVRGPIWIAVLDPSSKVEY